MGKSSKTNRVHTVDKVDRQTGSVFSSVDTNITVESEPDFCKIYLGVLYSRFKPTNSEVALFFKIVDFMEYDNEVHLKDKRRSNISEEMGLSYTTINHTIRRIVDKGLMFRTEYNTYIINPYIVARGVWKDIKNVKKSFGEDEGKWYYIPMNKVRDLKEIFKDYIKNQL